MFLSMRSALKINYYNLVSYSVVKNLPANEGDAGLVPGSGRSPGRGNSYHSCIHAWRIPWTEDPGGLQSMGLQRVGHDWVTYTFTLSSEETGVEEDYYTCLVCLEVEKVSEVVYNIFSACGSKWKVYSYPLWILISDN